jgi:glycosyltransferase involved in cell wall biosynthesis
MKILFVSESIWMAGVVYDLHIMAEGLSLLGHKVYAIDPGEDVDIRQFRFLPSQTLEACRVYPEASVHLRIPRFPRLFLGNYSIDKISVSRYLYKFFGRYSEINRFLKSEKIDIIVLYSAVRNGIQTSYLTKKYKIPIVFRNVDMLHKLWPTPAKRKMAKRSEKYVYPKMDMLLALTPKYAEYLIRLGADKTKVELLPFPINMEQFHPTADCSEIRHKWGLNDNDQVIVFIGTLYKFGGLVEFTRQFPSVLKQVPRAKLLIVGDGPIRPALEGIVADLNLKEHVIITGYQPFYHMPQYINAATVCLNVFPINETTKDIFSAKIIQYLSCGKATVSSALPGITTALPGEFCGVAYADTIDSVARKIVYLLKSPERRKRLERAGLEYVKQVHSHDKIILRLEEILKKLLGKNKRDIR